MDCLRQGGTTAIDQSVALDNGLIYTSESKRADSTGLASGRDHLTTGMVFDHTPLLEFGIAETFGASATLRGYLVSNQ